MKTKTGNREEVRTNSITVPMSSAEKASVKEMAQKMGLPVSTMVRMILKEHARKEQ